VFAATQRRNGNAVWFSFTNADRRVTCFYFYLWDVDFGPAFKVCAYFAYPVKVNGHEWAKRRATERGIAPVARRRGSLHARRGNDAWSRTNDIFDRGDPVALRCGWTVPRKHHGRHADEDPDASRDQDGGPECV